MGRTLPEGSMTSEMSAAVMLGLGMSGLAAGLVQSGLTISNVAEDASPGIWDIAVPASMHVTSTAATIGSFLKPR